jgi:outer membrane protein TolC
MSLVPALLVCFSLVADAPAPTEVKHLTLRDAIRISLENNLQVGIAQAARDVTQSGVMINEGTFDWNISAEAEAKKVVGVSTGLDYAAGAVPYTGHTVADTYARGIIADLTKSFTWGGAIDLNYSPAYSYSKSTTFPVPSLLNAGTNIPIATGNTSMPYSGSFTATYTQSLLQGFGVNTATTNLVVSRKNSAAADYTYQLAIINLASTTEGLYWNVVFADRNLANMKISLDLAQQQLKENNVRLEVGTMAPLDVTQAEAQVAQAEQNIIAAEAQVANSRDALLRALYPSGPRNVTVDCSDSPDLGHIQLDESAAEKMALQRRLELKNAAISKEVAKLQEALAKNKVLPQLNATAAYNGFTDSYSSLGPVNTDLTGNKYPGYTFGLQFIMPIQNRAAKGNLSVARANSRSAELTLHDTEWSIALQARTAVRNVEAGEKGVKAAAKTRYFQQATLDAERKKFENGMSTNFIVLQDMTNLDNAKSAELTAQIAYANAVTALEVAVGNLLEARHFVVK